MIYKVGQLLYSTFAAVVLHHVCFVYFIAEFFFFFAIILIIYSSLQDKVNICKYTSKLALDFERWPNFSSHRLCFASLFIARSYVSYFVYHVHLTRCEISSKILEFCSLLKTCFNLQMYKFSIHVSKLTISRVLFFLYSFGIIP